VAELWARAPVLMPTPVPFDGFVEHTKRVSPTCLIHFERNRYSVPATFANRPISSACLRPAAWSSPLRAQVIAEHERLFDRKHDRPGRTIYDWRHYLAVLQRKPGALRNGAPFGIAGRPSNACRRAAQAAGRRPRDGRDLALVLHHDEQAVLTAVELALESGVPSKLHVLNLLGSPGRATPPAPIETPQDLVLRREPQANVLRYDSCGRTVMQPEAMMRP
jgi:hypothetical protein